MIRSRALAAALLAAALLLGACAERASDAPTPPPSPLPRRTATPAVALPVYQVERGDITDGVTLSGRVTAASDQDVAFAQAGYIKVLAVRRGSPVKAGQVLAELDLGELPDQLSKAQSALAQIQQGNAAANQRRSLAVQGAQIQLANALGMLERARRPASGTGVAQAASDVEKARLKLTQTRADLSARKSEAAAAIDRAGNALRDAQAAYSAALWRNGNKPDAELNAEQRAAQDAARRTVENAQSAVDQAKVDYDLAIQNETTGVALAEQDVVSAQLRLDASKIGPDPLEIAAAERGVAAAQVAVSSAAASGDDPGVAQRTADAQAAIDAIQKKIDAARLLAPTDGIVAEVGVNPGDKVEAFAPVVNIINPSQLVIVVSDVGADVLARLSAGQPVSIQFGRAPEQPVQGQIAQLPSSLTATGTGVRSDSRLKVTFARGDLTLAVGDMANVNVTLAKADGVLWLPPQAIRSFDTRRFVVLRGQRGERQVDVTLGMGNAQRVQIISGLTQGDLVVAPQVGG